MTAPLLELDSNFVQAHNDLATTHSVKGMPAEAVDESLKAKSLSGPRPETIAALRQLRLKREGQENRRTSIALRRFIRARTVNRRYR
jgi:hypothetical protein